MLGLIHLLQAVFLGLWSAIWIPVALAIRLLTGSARLPLTMARRIWAPPLLWLAGVELEVVGTERVDFGRACLFASNHQSIFDIPALFVAVPVPLRFVARSALRRIPLLGWYMVGMGMVFVERSRATRSTAAVDHATEILAAGNSLLTFPEGTRSRDGRVAEFKGAPLAPAVRAGVPVVPVAIEGAFEVLPTGPFRPRPGRIRVSFGDPIETRDLDLGDRRELSSRVRERVLALQEPPTDSG